MKKYIIYFAITYLIAMAIMAVIIYFFNLPNGTSVACIMTAGFVTANKFVQDHQRAPEAAEKIQLIWGCLATSIAISLITTIIIILVVFKSLAIFTLFTALPLWIICVAVGFTLFIHYLILAMSFGWMANNAVKGLQKQKQKQRKSKIS
ncbi:ABZJ_00895 family protein [Acinetobacter sp. SwsAc6]|uniref:ABZJ_00895 family protein n=1 Tax=Acinetobacter sp. SwsAc6 TaxID=2749439 RepID=UPI001C4D9429|nr:ABZJ_00895 family protein [Acinetobacter sp. SwsAc6]